MAVRKILATVLASMLFATLAQAQSTAQPIHFRIVHGFAILTQGEIAGLHHLNILIDTGAVPSVLNRRVAAKIGAHGASGDFSLLSGRGQARYASVTDVRLSWAYKASLDVVILDLAGLEEKLGTRIDAIVGLDLFDHQDFSIDYQQMLIRPGLSRKARHQVPAEILYVDAAPYWVLPAQCDQVNAHLLLDTGADGLTLFADTAAPAVRPQRQGSQLNSFATVLAGPAPDAKGRFLLGDAIFANQRHAIAHKPAGALGDLNGLLGPTALHIRHLEFDWQNALLWWDQQ
jgi:predicted aspartyl protease